MGACRAFGKDGTGYVTSAELLQVIGKVTKATEEQKSYFVKMYAPQQASGRDRVLYHQYGPYWHAWSNTPLAAAQRRLAFVELGHGRVGSACAPSQLRHEKDSTWRIGGGSASARGWIRSVGGPLPVGPAQVNTTACKRRFSLSCIFTPTSVAVVLG